MRRLKNNSTDEQINKKTKKDSTDDRINEEIKKEINEKTKGTLRAN